MSDVIVAPETRDLDVLATQIAGWLAGRLGGAPDLRLTNLTYPRGAGQSHETILFDASWTRDGAPHAQGFVVRIKPGRFTVYPHDLFEEQYRVMQVVGERGEVPVARTLGYEPDAEMLGAPFFLMEKVVGRVPVSIPRYSEVGWVADATPQQRARMWENGVRTLARIQKTPLADVAFLKDAGEPGEGLEQEWRKYVRFAEWDAQYRPWPVLDAALERLRARWPRNQPPGLVWGDARIGNMMFDDDFNVVAVMDWEQPSLGGALHDLAWWVVNADMMHAMGEGRPSLSGMGSREETIALWQEETGIPVDDFAWYEDFTRFKLSCLSIRHMSLKGQPLPEESWLAERLKV